MNSSQDRSCWQRKSSTKFSSVGSTCASCKEAAAVRGAGPGRPPPPPRARVLAAPWERAERVSGAACPAGDPGPRRPVCWAAGRCSAPRGPSRSPQRTGGHASLWGEEPRRPALWEGPARLPDPGRPLAHSRRPPGAISGQWRQAETDHGAGDTAGWRGAGPPRPRVCRGSPPLQPGPRSVLRSPARDPATLRGPHCTT